MTLQIEVLRMKIEGKSGDEIEERRRRNLEEANNLIASGLGNPRQIMLQSRSMSTTCIYFLQRY